MSRPTDTERGARIAAAIAQSKLDAQYAPLFPLRLTHAENALWCDILERADEAIAEARAYRAAVSA